MNEAVKRAKIKYRSKIKRLDIELYPTDYDIIEWLDSISENGEPKATYIKRIIREDMQRRSNAK